MKLNEYEKRSVQYERHWTNVYRIFMSVAYTRKSINNVFTVYWYFCQKIYISREQTGFAAATSIVFTVHTWLLRVLCFTKQRFCVLAGFPYTDASYSLFSEHNTIPSACKDISFEPVSYTHLDVYKRQVPHTLPLPLGNEELTVWYIRNSVNWDSVNRDSSVYGKCSL